MTINLSFPNKVQVNISREAFTYLDIVNFNNFIMFWLPMLESEFSMPKYNKHPSRFQIAIQDRPSSCKPKFSVGRYWTPVTGDFDLHKKQKYFFISYLIFEVQEIFEHWLRFRWRLVPLLTLIRIYLEWNIHSISEFFKVSQMLFFKYNKVSKDNR